METIGLGRSGCAGISGDCRSHKSGFELWVFVGADSGFEGRREPYVGSIRVAGVGDLGPAE